MAAQDQPLAHMVYFTLRERTSAAVAQLVASCHQYLNGHPGTLYFSVGTLNPDLQREVNDREFDVALHVVFANRAAHDLYQAADRHEQFIRENKASWARVRVFDSDLSSP